MTESPTHRRQRSKNLFFLIALLLLVAGFYYLAILKMGGDGSLEFPSSQVQGEK